jgi:hypothetical protein
VLAAVASRLARTDPPRAGELADDIVDPGCRLDAQIARLASAPSPEIAGRALDAALRIEVGSARAAGVSALAAVLGRQAAELSRPGRASLVEFIAGHGRPDGLPVCLAAGPLWALWGGNPVAADAVFDAVDRVTRWWP